MGWEPQHLTREQMEERRRTGAKLSQAEIARQLGVSPASVSDWSKRLTDGGLRALRRRKAPGRPAGLTPAADKELRRLLRRGATAAGFPTDRWTLSFLAVKYPQALTQWVPGFLSQWVPALFTQRVPRVFTQWVPGVFGQRVPAV
jgi:hypothetical protein